MENTPRKRGGGHYPRTSSDKISSPVFTEDFSRGMVSGERRLGGRWGTHPVRPMCGWTCTGPGPDFRKTPTVLRVLSWS